jgi:hypothetical protein
VLQRGTSELGRRSRHFAHEHRDFQALARGLAGQELLAALRQMSARTVMLRALMRQETRTQEHGMLAVLVNALPNEQI